MAPYVRGLKGTFNGIVLERSRLLFTATFTDTEGLTSQTRYAAFAKTYLKAARLGTG
jgi:hypothetical protein